jgi:hypothetical protein
VTGMCVTDEWDKVMDHLCDWHVGLGHKSCSFLLVGAEIVVVF